MLVKDFMSRHPFMLDVDSSIVDAQRYMREVHVRHLPVVGDGKRLLGLITRETLMIEPGTLDSLNVWEITRYLSSLKVRKIMIKAREVISIEENAAIEDAALLMVENKIGCLPVLKRKVVVGLITEEDLLLQLCRLLDTRRPGMRIAVSIPDKKGETRKLVACIEKNGWGIQTIGGMPDPKDDTRYTHVVKITANVPMAEVEKIINQIEGHVVTDIRETV
ncbi:MAG: CBS domain-containing protein [Deltaproteobacteria bacterium]|nr:CBS domain-containing protein [Deltaproteobacteria bacterium]